MKTNFVQVLLATAMMSTAQGATVTPKLHGAIEVLQVTGALTNVAGAVGGGGASAEKRSVYLFELDKPSTPSETTCAEPTYTGGAWPLVYVDSVELDASIEVGLCVASPLAGSTSNILCCKVDGYGLMPMYQYVEDLSADTAKGNGAGKWWTVDSKGGSPAPGSSPSSGVGLEVPNSSSAKTCLQAMTVVAATVFNLYN